MEVILVARSIGKPTRSAPLRPDGHAGLVFNLGSAGINDHWIVQGGPHNDLLRGNVYHCSSQGWYHEFSMAHGAIWDSHEAMVLPILVLDRKTITIITILTSARLTSISDQLNRRHLRYNYENGPNSNTYVSMFLGQLGIHIAYPPNRGLELKGWNWR